MADTYYTPPTPYPSSDQGPQFTWQDAVYYPLKVIRMLPQIIYKVVWTAFWRYWK